MYLGGKPQQQSGEEVAKMLKELEELKEQREYEKRQLSSYKQQLLHLQSQSRTLQTLTSGMFGMLEVSHIYGLVCECLVYELGWDSSFVVTLKEGVGHIEASYQATQKQHEQVQHFLPQDQQFLQAYSHRHTITTFHDNQSTALSLRTLFQTDEVIGTPILFGDRLFAYLFVCSHSEAGKKMSVHDLDFISRVASQVGQAVQQSLNLLDLEQQNKRLRELDEMKNSFISITSHQLRTPLSIVKWILSILQSDKNLSPFTEQMNLINQAYESNERLIRVVNDLLNISRIQDDKLPFAPQSVDLASMVSDLAESAQKTAGTRGITFISHINKEIELLDLDPLLFKDAIHNLLENALDYCGDKGTVEVSLEKTENKVVLQVKNTGLIITTEEKEKIFDQFYRSPEAVKVQPNGNGLGLYLTRVIVREHGGDIVCESEENSGTSFTINLPLPVSA